MYYNDVHYKSNAKKFSIFRKTYLVLKGEATGILEKSLANISINTYFSEKILNDYIFHNFVIEWMFTRDKQMKNE